MFILTRDIKNRQDALNEFFGFFNHEFDALALGCTLKTTDLPDFLGPLAGGGGGVVIYLKDCFPFFVLQHVCRMDANVEYLVEAKQFVAALYRRPAGNV